MFRITILLIFVITIKPLFSQFYVGPIVGYGLSEISTDQPQATSLLIDDDGYKGGGISVGLYAEYQMTNTLFMSYSLIHNSFKDKSNVLDPSELKPGNFEFKSLYNSLNIGYFYKPFFVSAGPSFSYNSNVENNFDDNSRKLNGSNSLSFAGNVKAGLSYKNFIVAVDYIYDFNKRFDVGEFDSIKPIKTIFFSVAYMFELGGIQRGKMTTCPRF